MESRWLLEPVREKKELSLSYLLWCLSFVGVCGVQRIYLGQLGYGVVMLLTLGLCGIGQLLDLVLLPDAVKAANHGLLSEDQPAPEVAATSPSYPTSSEASRPPVQADDAELDQLLSAAQESFHRTQQKSGE